MIPVENVEDFKAFLQVAAGQNKGCGLARGEEPAMDFADPTVEIRKRPVEIFFLMKKVSSDWGLMCGIRAGNRIRRPSKFKSFSLTTAS